jgi:hypothetical protein
MATRGATSSTGQDASTTTARIARQFLVREKMQFQRDIRLAGYADRKKAGQSLLEVP